MSAPSAPPALRIGSLALESNLCLAPLAGWTSLAFRLVVRGLGGVGLATTEVVSARALLTGSRKTGEFLKTDPADRPLAVQINAATAAEARDAAQLLEARGFDAVDLNLGCPVNKIARKGGGAGLARDLDGAAAVAGAAAAAVKIPGSAKMRLGWGAGDLTAPELARALEAAGVAAVAVHGRTRAQGFGGAVDLAGIRAVAAAVRAIPVIGNGDVKTASDAKRMLDETGAHGVLIGRAAVTNPWIFVEARALLAGGDLPPPPPLEARLAACERHFALLARDLGEAFAALRFRKVLRAWGRALHAGERFWQDAAAIASGADVRALLDRVRRGETGEAAPDGAPVVAVPAGPVDLW